MLSQKKVHYSILFIEKILAQLKGVKYFIKIDIRQAFYQIKMSKNLEKLTIFLTSFDVFKYLVILFGLCNRPTS